MITELSLFSGIGAFSLGLKLKQLEVQTIGYVEIDPFCQAVLRARIREGFLDWAPIIRDIRSTDFRPMAGLVDIITASPPCQPFSVAGKQRKSDDDRNLFPDTLRVLNEVRPRYLIMENVPGLLSASPKRGRPSYGAVVVGQLAEAGYVVRWETVGADDVQAPHRRKRWWCIAELADSDGAGSSSYTRNDGKECSISEEKRKPKHGATLLGRGSAELADSIYDGPYPARADAPEPSGNESPDGLFVRGYPAKRAELADSGGRRYWQSNKEICSGGDTPEHGIGVLADSDSNRTRRDQSEHWEGGGSEQASQDLADGNNEGLEGIGANGHQERWQEQTVSPGLPGGTIPVWPPGPSDGDGWAELIERRPDLAPALTKEAESQFRRASDGATNRVHRLKALGNCVIPSVVVEFLRRVE